MAHKPTSQRPKVAVRTATRRAKPGFATAASKRKAAVRSAPAANPLLQPWRTPFETPPFDRIRSEHFLPAFEQALTDNLKEIATIAKQRAAPTFRNTIDALERSGRLLDRVGSVFFNLSGTDTSPEIQEIERKMAPRLAKHSMRIYQDARLFKRVARLMDRRARLDLSEEQLRVLERYHRAFLKSGAQLKVGAKKRLAAIAERLAKLATKFNQNVLADEQTFLLVLDAQRSCRPAGCLARRGSADGERPRFAGQVRDLPVAFQHRTVSAVLGPARFAREGVSRLDQPRRQRWQNRQSQAGGGNLVTARRARAIAGVRQRR